jgi:O-antigen/teichoic acid export membrane protein
LANLFASSVMFLLLTPLLRIPGGWKWDGQLLRRMIGYGIPLMIAGLAGIANEMADRQFIKYLLPESTALEEVGVYGAVYKLSIFLVLFVQAYRYAMEPFFFRSEGGADKDGKTNAQVLKAFLVVLGFFLVALNGALPWVRHFIDEKFWVGLSLAPILFASNFILGINTHLSIWYKLSGKTHFAMVITFSGLVVTLVVNLIYIPKIGILGAAWATFFSYLTMMILNLILGARYARIPYDYKRLGLYFTSSILLGFFAWKLQATYGPLALLLCVAFGLIVFMADRKFIATQWNNLKR